MEIRTIFGHMFGSMQIFKNIRNLFAPGSQFEAIARRCINAMNILSRGYYRKFLGILCLRNILEFHIPKRDRERLKTQNADVLIDLYSPPVILATNLHVTFAHSQLM